MSQSPPAAWHPDPFRRFQLRYWDGVQWTEHVASNGQQWSDPPVGAPPPAATYHQPAPVSGAPLMPRPTRADGVPVVGRAKKVQKQLQKAGLVSTSGLADRSVFNEPVLVINQKGKLVELRAEYAIYGQDGRQLAAVRGKRISTRVQIVDIRGNTLLDMRRESNLLTSKRIVTGAGGAKIGRIVPSLSWNQVDRDFKLEDAGNVAIGGVYTEDRHRSGRQRHREFNVQDAGGSVVARISKTRAGLAKELFTKGDNYVVSFEATVGDPLRSLSIAAALGIDFAYHQ